MRILPALALLLALPACGQDAKTPEQAAATKPDGKALTAAIADNGELETLSSALASTGISARPATRCLPPPTGPSPRSATRARR